MMASDKRSQESVAPFHRIHVHPVALSAHMWGQPFYSLGCLSAYSRHYKQGALNDYFRIGKVGLWNDTSMLDLLQQASKAPPAIYLLSSYTWNHALCMQFSDALKQISPRSLVIIGGPNIPRAEKPSTDFLLDNSCIDIMGRGEGEVTLAELLEVLAKQCWPRNPDPDLSAVTGISWRRPLSGVSAGGRGAEIVRNPDRARAENLDDFPSPYLSGEFSDWFTPEVKRQLVTILETNRGCPYGCTFCDWGAATLQKIKKFPMEKIKQEIDYIFSGTEVGIFCADANFGIFERDVEIADYMARKSLQDRCGYRLHATYAKHPTEKLARIIHLFRESGLAKAGCISIQTRDPISLEAIERSNIKNEKYDTLIAMFNQERMPLSSELMIGLPGQTYASYKDDLQFFVDRKIHVQTYRTSVMPNAPMADTAYMAKYGIEVGLDDRIVSTFSAPKKAYQRMVQLFVAYQLMIGCGVGKYLGYYLQLEHDIKIMDMIEIWLEESVQADRYPISAWASQNMLKTNADNPDAMLIYWGVDAVRVFHELESFYGEIIAMLESRYGKSLACPALAAVLQVQQAVMPKENIQTPFSLDLRHDYLAWYQQVLDATSLDERSDALVPLADFPPARFTVPRQVRRWKKLSFGRINSFENEWELKNPLSLY